MAREAPLPPKRPSLERNQVHGFIVFVTKALDTGQPQRTRPAMTTLEKVTEKLDEIASRASTRRDVGQLVDALRSAVSTIAMLGAPPTRMTAKERLKVCDDAIERIARELGG